MRRALGMLPLIGATMAVWECFESGLEGMDTRDYGVGDVPEHLNGPRNKYGRGASSSCAVSKWVPGSIAWKDSGALG
jgi:hypothetical protein